MNKVFVVKHTISPSNNWPSKDGKEYIAGIWDNHDMVRHYLMDHINDYLSKTQSTELFIVDIGKGRDCTVQFTLNNKFYHYWVESYEVNQ